MCVARYYTTSHYNRPAITYQARNYKLRMFNKLCQYSYMPVKFKMFYLSWAVKIYIKVKCRLKLNRFDAAMMIWRLWTTCNQDFPLFNHFRFDQIKHFHLPLKLNTMSQIHHILKNVQILKNISLKNVSDNYIRNVSNTHQHCRNASTAQRLRGPADCPPSWRPRA